MMTYYLISRIAVGKSRNGVVETPVSVRVFLNIPPQPKIYSDLPNNYNISCEI